MVGMAAASPSAQKVRPSMFFDNVAHQIDVAFAPAAVVETLAASFFSQVVPSRQGMHQPQLSCA